MDKLKRIDDLFSQWDKEDSPGLALSVAVDGDIIFKKGYGFANLEYDIPITPSTIFHVASVSKQFTALSILLLEKQGKLSIYDDVHDYIPELPDFGKDINIDHLIHHTSGLRDQWELLSLSGWRRDDIITKERIMKAIMRQRALNFEPGTKYLYSNSGYVLMAEIVERVSGQSFLEFTKENIFKPLNMDHTHFHDDNDMIVKNRAYSYKKDNKLGFKKDVLNYSNVGATSLFTTVEDLAKWGNNFTTFTVGGESTIERMLESYTLKDGESILYARGVNVDNYRGIKTIYHGGSDAGFRTNMLCFPEQKMTISMFSNLGSFDPAYYSNKVAEIFLPEKDFLEEGLNLYKNLRYENEEVINKNIGELEGQYLMDIKLLASIKAENNELFIHLPKSQKSKLLPIEKDLYIDENTETLIQLKIDDNDKLIGIKLIYPSNETEVLKKIFPIELSEVKLDGYTGSYCSNELGTHYDIVREKNKLMAKHIWNQDVELIPYDEDIFIADGERFKGHLSGEMNWVRNQGQEIMGFKLNGGRVNNLWFHRKAD